MGMTAAVKLKKVAANTTNVLAIEACAAAQAIDFLAPLKTSALLQQAHAAIRKVSAKIEQDRVFATDFAKVALVLQSGTLVRVTNPS
jgi:histidine ammonia-lyase